MGSKQANASRQTCRSTPAGLRGAWWVRVLSRVCRPQPLNLPIASHPHTEHVVFVLFKQAGAFGASTDVPCPCCRLVDRKQMAGSHCMP